MGKKYKKQNPKQKLFDKTNSANFTLTFLKPILSCEKPLSKELSEKIKQSLIPLTTTSFLQNRSHQEYLEKLDDDDELQLEEDIRDEVETGPELDDFQPGEVALNEVNSFLQQHKETAPNTILLSKKKKYVLNKNEVLKIDGSETLFDEPINLDSFLNLLAQNTDIISYEKDKVFFRNSYMLKFNVNFELDSTLSIINFDSIIDQATLLLRHEKCQKFILEIPFDVISRLNKCRRDDPRLSRGQYHRAYLGKFSLGSMVNLSNYFVHFVVPETEDQRMVLELKFLLRGMTIYFQLDTSWIVNRIFYNFSSFRTIIVERHKNFDRIYFECTAAPIMHYAELTDQECKFLKEADPCDIEKPNWKRTVNFKFRANKFVPQPQNNEETLLGMANTFCIDVMDTDQDPFFDKIIHIAYICREKNKSFQLFISSLQHKESRRRYDNFQTLLDKYNFPFSIHYACLVLFSPSYKVHDSLDDERCYDQFFNDIKYSVDNSQNENELACLEQIIYYLKVQVRESVILNVYEEFTGLLKHLDEHQPEELHPDYVMIRRATLFPSHLELVQPVSLLRSRFTNLANMEYGIRMTILDNNDRVLNKCKEQAEFDFIMGIIKPKLLHGLKIRDRKYEFLGSSTSQMRDNGCTLYAQDERGNNAEDVRNSAGHLKKFNRSVSKYIARFGLVFSQSMTIIPVGPEVTINMTPDYLGDVKPNVRNYINRKMERHILSDGIGLVSRAVAEDWLPHLQLKQDYFPSAYQIRYGGSKGMLTVWDLQKGSKKIIFRESMKKYDSDSRLMGILKYSWPRWVFLNRPLINILDHLNVNRREFYNYFYQSTASVAKATLYDSCAMDLIRTYATGLIPYDHVLNCGISLLDEPFLRSIINYLIYYRLNFELKWKARIRVPNDTGRIAFGVIDETRELQYGEIYFQYTKMNEEGGILPETYVLEGEVLVTKFPCLQPGDVRKFKAVKIDKLSHVKDCLVFPANGPRPHPDEMGGSDLDGDEYAIFWNTLEFPGENRKPMDFPYGLSHQQEYDITNEDLINFFCSYLMMNNIGMVANMHLMLSDYLAGGLDTVQCEDLAYTYQISLDFPKTGVILDSHQLRRYHLSIRPDFMERNVNDKVYLSKKVLGEFYRHCSLVECAIELSQYDYRFSMFDPSQKRKKRELNTKQFNNPKSLIKNKLILPGWKKFYAQADQVFSEYKLKVVDIMEQLEVENEVMLFADVYEDKKDVAKSLINNMFKHFKKMFEDQCTELDCLKSIDRLYLASAWYAICYEKSYYYNGKPLLGLPWIIPEEICQLAQFNFSSKVATEAALKRSTRTMVNHKGEKWHVCIGINHKELVLYEPEKELYFDTLFDYQTKAVFGTDVVHHYWCPYEMIQFFNKNHPHLLNLFYEILDQIQFRIVFNLIMKWIEMIKTKIYNDSNLNNIRIFPLDTTQKPFDTNEDVLFQNFIKERLERIYTDCGRKPNRIGFSLPTISSIFNNFLQYLFQIFNLSNLAIFVGRLEECFLLKYAIFSLSFINQLDWKLDRSFYTSFSADLQTGNTKTHIFLLNSINSLKKSGQYSGLNELFPPEEFESINLYQNSLASFFESYIANNSCLVMENVRFNLLHSSGRVALPMIPEVLLPRLYFLTGIKVEDIQVTQSKEDEQHLQITGGKPSEPDNKNQTSTSKFGNEEFPSNQTEIITNLPDYHPREHRNRSNGPQRGRFGRAAQPQKQIDPELLLKYGHYQVNLFGLNPSIKILRNFLGHFEFFEKVCFQFEVLKPK